MIFYYSFVHTHFCIPLLLYQNIYIQYKLIQRCHTYCTLSGTYIDKSEQEYYAKKITHEL